MWTFRTKAPNFFHGLIIALAFNFEWVPLPPNALWRPSWKASKALRISILVSKHTFSGSRNTNIPLRTASDGSLALGEMQTFLIEV